ncbi:hypothetical protein N9L26_01535 [Candidatus Pacebacteria bacterium]|nr:hypothetical protein [Candidatus Paceibacterota bacterium]
MPTKKSTTKKTTKSKPAVKKAAAKKVPKKKPTAKKPAAKKAAAKKTTKKTPTTKRAAASTTKRPTAKKGAADARVLVCANGEECFWTTDGKILRDLTELKEALDQISEETFVHHVNEERNDFADWVEQVLADRACATDLRKSTKPTTARTIVVRHLRSYSY